jgi:hypothetical protein
MLKKLIDLVKSLFAPSTPVQESPVVLVQEAVEVAKVEEVKKPKKAKKPAAKKPAAKKSK